MNLKSKTMVLILSAALLALFAAPSMAKMELPMSTVYMNTHPHGG